jgi:hypothetical protein
MCTFVRRIPCRPGGKYGPAGSSTATQAALAEGAQNEELRRAAEVVATAQVLQLPPRISLVCTRC